MISRASAVPDAIDALVSLLKTYPPLLVAAVEVLDGGPVSAIASPSTVLIIGGSGDESDVLASTGERVDASLGRGDDFETFDIACHLERWEGGNDTKAVRRATFDVLNHVKAALQADQTLGGAVTRARLTGRLDHATAHFSGDTGCGIPFVIRCKAL